MGGDDRRKRGRVFRNIYKGHMDKTKGRCDEVWEVEMAGVGGEWWGENGDNCSLATSRNIKKNKNKLSK